MQFLLTDREAVEVIRNGVRHSDGLLLIRVPVSCYQESSEHRLTLVFSSNSHTAHWGKRSTRLSPTLFSLLQYVHQRKRVTFEDAQDAVWQQEIDDTVIRNSCSRLSSRLLDAGIPFALLTRHGSILLEEVTP